VPWQKALESKSSGNEAASKSGFVSTNIYFPQLSDWLRTHEERLGVYHFFQGKTVGGMYVDRVKYHGERALWYDKEGVTVVNREYGGMIEKSIPPEPLKHIVSGPYLYAHATHDNTDLYPFVVQHPRKNLAKHFNAEPSMAASSSSNEGMRLSSDSVSVNVTVITQPQIEDLWDASCSGSCCFLSSQPSDVSNTAYNLAKAEEDPAERLRILTDYVNDADNKREKFHRALVNRFGESRFVPTIKQALLSPLTPIS